MAALAPGGHYPAGPDCCSVKPCFTPSGQEHKDLSDRCRRFFSLLCPERAGSELGSARGCGAYSGPLVAAWPHACHCAVPAVSPSAAAKESLNKSSRSVLPLKSG